MHYNFISLMCTFFTITKLINSSRILAIVPTPSYSHQVPFYPLWRALSERGHDITLITTDPMDLNGIQNIRQINLKSAYDTMKKNDFENFISSGSASIIEFIPTVLNIFSEVVEEEFSHPEVADLIKNDKEHFDLIMVEVFFPTMVVFAERFKCPFIGINSNDAHRVIHRFLGNPVHPVMYPEAFVPYDKEASLLTRLKSAAIMLGIEQFLNFFVLPRQNKIVRKYFGGGYHNIEETLKNMSMLFIVGDSFLQNVRPIGPNTIYIGGTGHIGKPKPLPQDLQNFLDSAKEGAIYFSLGSNVKSKDLPKDKRKMIIDVLSKLPYKVLWKFEADDLVNKPENIMLTKWAPQHDVLNHPNIKLFITQGGLQSLQESVFFNVPVLVIPFMGDQISNAKRAVEQGLGLTLDISLMTGKDFKESVVEIITNEKYRKRVKEFSDIIKDQPMNGLEKAVWWTEYVIRHKGAEQLRNPAADTPFYQYYLLDIIGIVSLIIFGMLYVVQRILRFILRGFCLMIFGRKKVKTN